MNGDQFIASLDARLRDVEVNQATQTQAAVDLKERFEDVEVCMEEVRLYLARQEGAEEEIKKAAKGHGRTAGSWAGAMVSAAFFGITYGFKALVGLN